MSTDSLYLPNAAATLTLGHHLGQSLAAGTVLLLEGDLGAGKTTLTQGLGQGLGITDPIVSPTFTLLNEYPEGRVPLYHFDLYRLDSQGTAGLNPELYWEGWEVESGIVVIEWPDRLPYRPASYLTLALTVRPDPDEGREAEFGAIGNAQWPMSRDS
jgi:tRNA threonylcarbamoyladenosine biosynthesis protein TsaE